MIPRAIALLLTFIATPALAQQQAARDATRPATGTATIAGVVLADDTEHRPIRRARVTLTSSELPVGQTAITGDDGAFAFHGLPPGRYMLAPYKESYVSIAYGATRPSRPGAALVVGNGETKRVSLRLMKGSVITGTILNLDGSPATGVSIRAMRYAFMTGERQLVPAGAQTSTDDRGTYRLYGLQAGDYVISCSSRSGALASADVHPITASEMQSALDELRGGPSQSRAAASGAGAGDPPRVFGYAAVYYPGTTQLGEAATISVAQGEERGGIDFQLQFVPMARVSGTVANSDGTPPPAMTTVTLIANASAAAMMDSIRVTRADAEGKFTVNGIAPGRYVVSSRASAGATSTSAMPDVGTLWAAADLTVEGTDLTDFPLTLQRGFTIKGRLAFEGPTAPPSNLAAIRITLTPIQGPGEMSLVTSPARVDAQGQFTISGVTPGRYRLTATLSAASIAAGLPDRSPWMLKSSVMDGQDTLTAPYQLQKSVEDAVITFTDRTTEFAGVVRDAAGEPSPACYVVVAPTDRMQWTAQSRRINAIRPASDGKYSLRNMPPGEYLIAAVSDVEQGEWYDPAFLQRFAMLAATTALGDGEHKTQDLTVR